MWKTRSFIVTESRGVALWWPFTDHRYKLRLPNPIEYTWNDASLWETTMDIVLMNRSRLKQSVGVTISVLVVTFVSATATFSQDKQRIVHWPEAAVSTRHMTSSTYTIVPQIEVVEIVDVAVGGKSITLGEKFAADDEWLKNLTLRIKNVSSTSIIRVQLNLFLPQIMPGGPMVTLCYGCGDVGRGQSIAPGEEVEMKIVFYSWLLGQITSKSNLSNIDKAEIQNMLVTLPNEKILFSSCVKTANQKNACIPN